MPIFRDKNLSPTLYSTVLTSEDYSLPTIFTINFSIFPFNEYKKFADIFRKIADNYKVFTDEVMLIPKIKNEKEGKIKEFVIQCGLEKTNENNLIDNNAGAQLKPEILNKYQVSPNAKLNGESLKLID